MSSTAPPASPEQRIFAAICALGCGQVSSYGVIAQRAGLPGRARLVARLLGQNEDASLPWHRVLRADGRIAFPPGSAGWQEQTRRLQAVSYTHLDVYKRQGQRFHHGRPCGEALHRQI